MTTDALLAAVAALSGWEALAVVLAVAYLLLAVRQNIWCWLCAAGSTAIYLVLMAQAQLYSESALQIFYLAMAAYGWYQWRYHPGLAERLPVTTWPLRTHALAIAGCTVASLALGWGMSRGTDAAYPYLDAATTCFAVVTTYMVTRKVLENWLYWFVIDAVSIFLYAQRGLPLTALLFAAYLVIIVFGWRAWRADYRGEFAADADPRAAARGAA